ncbi:putative phosphoglycerate mutase [Podosphaera aphanis]|nr:putative phosphoglycerate mutase [Podosphaera aphanis]
MFQSSMLQSSMVQPWMGHFKITSVPTYFLQDDPTTDPHGFDFMSTNFGLINRSYDSDSFFDPALTRTQWERFGAEVARLNNEGNPATRYKVLYMGRHGQGYHNVAEDYYGTKAWDAYWSLLDGNGTMSWLDAELTPLGISQAQAAGSFWEDMIKREKIPVPRSYYVSPLTRCSQTAWNTFASLDLPVEWPFKPLVKELLRECIGVHTCDKRSSRSVIHAKFPEWSFEDEFAEEDELWSPKLRETNEAMDQRAKVVLEDILTNDSHTYISISSHSGQIASVLRVLGHRDFMLGTGQVIPILVRIEKKEGVLPPEKKAAWFMPETCSEPPSDKTTS